MLKQTTVFKPMLQATSRRKQCPEYPAVFSENITLFASMNDTVCARVLLKPGSLPKVHEWACEINSRRPEALETLAAEGVFIESVFLDSSADGDYLVYYIRAKSINQAKEVASKSVSSIDGFHKEFKRETWVQVRNLELLLDLARGDV
jgi:hypothetical protein